VLIHHRYNPKKNLLQYLNVHIKLYMYIEINGGVMEISAANFRTNCFKILDEVDKKHKEIVITKRGKPIAKLVRYETNTTSDPLLGSLAGVGSTVGDLTAPFGDNWELD